MALGHVDKGATLNNLTKVTMKAMESISGLSHDHIGRKLMAFGASMVPFILCILGFCIKCFVGCLLKANHIFLWYDWCMKSKLVLFLFADGVAVFQGCRSYNMAKQIEAPKSIAIHQVVRKYTLQSYM